MKFTYHINLDERGDFYADVRNENGDTVYEIRTKETLDWGDSDIFEDGFMNHSRDIEGLENYLNHLGIMGPCDYLTEGE